TVGAAALAPIAAMAQQPTAATGAPPTVISNPPRQWGHHAPPNIYPDPDVIVIDPSFAALRVGNNAIHRIATGFTWAEGPAWSSEDSTSFSVTLSEIRSSACCGMIDG